jgi:uncharacterized protein (TIGR02246 family)
MVSYERRSHGIRQRGPLSLGLRSRASTGETEPVSAAKADAPRAVVAALADAMNAHDIEAFVSLFAADYDSEQPVHPDRAFRGRDQVRANWTAVFAGVPDFRAELVATAVEADTVWTEWRWHGTHQDGSPLEMAGVIILSVREGRVAQARLYVEPVQRGGEGIDAAVRDMSGRD